MAEPWLTTDEPADEALVARCAAGDLTAFSAIYDRYQRPVYSLAAHLLGPAEAEDAVQEVFLGLWRHVDQFDETRGRFAPWFMAIARHEMFARLRRRSREERLALATDIERLLAAAPDPAADVEEHVWQRERGEHVLCALNALPVEQRRVLVLAYFGGLSQSTIAESLGWPLGTVKKRVRLGLQKLRRALAVRDMAAPGRSSVSVAGQADPAHPRHRVSVEDGPSAD